MTVEQAKQVMRDNGYLSPMWQKADIIGKAEDMGVELTTEQVDKVAENIERFHNAEIGINWDVIESNIDMVLTDQ